VTLARAGIFHALNFAGTFSRTGIVRPLDLVRFVSTFDVPCFVGTFGVAQLAFLFSCARLLGPLDLADFLHALGMTRFVRVAYALGTLNPARLVDTLGFAHVALVLLAQRHRRIAVIHPLRALTVVPAAMRVEDRMTFVHDVRVRFEIRWRRGLDNIDPRPISQGM
jgi:hypothetical protein